MPLAQPKIMFAFDATSGKTVHNYGTAADGAINAAAACVENTDFAWVPGATALLSYLSLITKDNSPATSSQPFIDLTGYTLGTTFSHIYTAVGFRLTSLDTSILNEGYLGQQTGGRGGLKLKVTPNGGGFDLLCHWETAGFFTVGETLFAGLSFGTDYRVVAYCNPTNTAAVVTKFLLDGGSVIAPATTGPGTDNWNTDVGYIDRRHDFAVYGGVVARLYYWVHDRGVALSDADMAAINSNPATAWTGWPSGVITANIGLVTETDSAFSFTSNKAKAIGQPSETDSAFSMVPNGSVVFLDVAHLRELRDDANAIVASLTGIPYAWYDNPATPLSGGTPVATGTFDTDAAGAARFNIPGTTLLAGQTGALLTKHPSLARYHYWPIPIGP